MIYCLRLSSLTISYLKYEFGLWKFVLFGNVRPRLRRGRRDSYRKFEVAPEYSGHYFRRYDTCHACDAIASEAADLVLADDVVETEWRSRARTCAQGKKTVSSQTAGSPVNRNGAAASVSSIALGGRPAPEHNSTRIKTSRVRPFPTLKFPPLACAREADVRAEHRRRMRSPPSSLPLSLSDG